MAIPPRRWVGYAFVVAGLSLLFDTYTFLRTNWSPLHVPMFAATEIALGYSLVAVGSRAAVVISPQHSHLKTLRLVCHLRIVVVKRAAPTSVKCGCHGH
jgi:hypothetical protein